MRHSESFEARRTFCPLLPMARDSWSSGTITSMVRFAWSITTLEITAGASALTTNLAGSGLYSMISIFSPRNSWTTLCTRDPFIPTQAPTGSMSGSLEVTAILALLPGSRWALIIVTIPSAISGTSKVNRLMRNSGWVRLRMICGPRLSLLTSST